MKRILTILTALLTLTGCNTWLDVKPDTQKTVDEMFDSYAGFKDVLTGCYIKLISQNLYGKQLTVTTVEYLAQHWDYDSQNMTTEDAMKSFDYANDGVKSRMKAIYGELYNTITQANTILLNIKTKGHVIPDEATRSIIEGEALAMRAFCHLDALRLFGQTPDGKSDKVSLPYSETASVKDIPYYDFEAFTAKIEADLNRAEALLKGTDPVFSYSFDKLDRFESSDNNKITLTDSYLGYRRFRFNYYAVRAIKARLYGYVGRRAEAAQIAQSVIAECGLKLAGDNDLNSNNYVLPSETLLGLSNFNLESYMNDVFAIGSLTRYTTALYLDSESLKNQLFAGCRLNSNNRYNKVWNINSTDPTGATKPTLRKYYQDGQSYPNVDLVTKKQAMPLIRLSEMYLIAMEGSSSLSTVNELLSLYQTARNELAEPFESLDQVSEWIKNEYRREFFGEGQMFYLYKRFDSEQMMWKNDAVKPNNYLIPLPTTEYNPN